MNVYRRSSLHEENARLRYRNMRLLQKLEQARNETAQIRREAQGTVMRQQLTLLAALLAYPFLLFGMWALTPFVPGEATALPAHQDGSGGASNDIPAPAIDSRLDLWRHGFEPEPLDPFQPAFSRCMREERLLLADPAKDEEAFLTFLPSWI